ncbi:hypothetical protein INT45_000402 [Circinella minor]|uniref:MSP domain-containing protein n=1 Tax=Circinella minor TaxID=1195481 RepID=A0A8H7RX59_9FUNG|nr:hypothetical protein INT45_000402 [Circinella minor]
MSVLLEPSSYLTFTRPFAHPVATESITIQNPGNVPVSFKVKTTAPKQYCVKPNTGRIEPNEHVQVQVYLQPMKEKLVEGYKCKDKFLIQTTEIKATYENMNLSEMWQQIESEEKEMIYRHRIKCVITPSRRQSEPALKEKQYQQQREQREHHQKFLRSDTMDTLPMKDAPSPSSSTSSTTEEEENLMHQQHEERVVAVQEENARLAKQVQLAQEVVEQLRQELMLATRNQYEAEEKCRQYKEVLLQDLHAEEEEEDKENNSDDNNNNEQGEEDKEEMHLRRRRSSRNRNRRERLALMMLQEEKEEDVGHPIAVAWTAAVLTFGIAFYVFC